MAGLDKVVERLNSQKSKKELPSEKKKVAKVEEEEESEEEEGEDGTSEDDEDLEEAEQVDLDEEEADEDDEEIVTKKTTSTPKLSAEQQEALIKRNEEINLLHNDGLYRYEFLSQLISINDSLNKLNKDFNTFFALLRGKKDGKN
jgi:hypothetical protein